MRGYSAGMMTVRANVTNLPVRTTPMTASPISGDDNGKGLIESAYDPVIDQSDKLPTVTLWRCSSIATDASHDGVHILCQGLWLSRPFGESPSSENPGGARANRPHNPIRMET